MAKVKTVPTGKTVCLDDLLDWITQENYDTGRGLLGSPTWAVPSLALLDKLRNLSGMTKEEFTRAFDDARMRVHGRNVEGGTYLDE